MSAPSFDEVALANARCARSLISGLVAAGVRQVVAAPGARSTTLALAAAAHPDLQVRMVTDERSAGYFAIGLARVGGRPVVVVCTSGTAVANLVPSAAEAGLSLVPIVYLTADRPPESHDFGAPQTIRQSGLLGLHARWSCELPVPDPCADLDRHFAAAGARAGAVAAGRCGSSPGPVQLNAPFREPLLPSLASLSAVSSMPTQPDGEKRERGTPGAGRPAAPRVHGPRMAPADAAVAELARALAEQERGLIVCGPLPGPTHGGRNFESIAELASVLDWPLLADPLSGLRYGCSARAQVVDAYDVLLRSDDFCRRFRPSLVLRLGSLPTSKPLQRYLASAQKPSGVSAPSGAAGPARHVLVAQSGTWPDPDHLADDVLFGDARELAEALVPLLAGARRSNRARQWTRSWCAAGVAVREVVEAELEAEPAAGDASELFEGAIAHELVTALPEGAICWIGNSMPVRDLDTFTAATPSYLGIGANRGANGIDGVLSTALGAAAAAPGAPAALYLGDLSLLHDLGGLQIAARHAIPLLIVVASNDGGGIFSFLPQSALGTTFEDLFATPHGLDLAPAAALSRAHHVRVQSRAHLRERLAAWRERPTLELIEVPTDRKHNVRRHRQIVTAALDRLDAHLSNAA